MTELCDQFLQFKVPSRGEIQRWSFKKDVWLSSFERNPYERLGDLYVVQGSNSMAIAYSKVKRHYSRTGKNSGNKNSRYFLTPKLFIYNGITLELKFTHFNGRDLNMYKIYDDFIKLL